MNYLAHLYFARPNSASRVGNLLGDFARGVNIDALPDPVRLGVLNHRAIDRYTDQHPEVRQLKALFSPQRRRFSGIILDVLFDHFLLHHWQTFHTRPLPQFLAEAYADLTAGMALMPPPMQHVVQRMISADWISSYRDLDQVGIALNRISTRIRYPNRFQDALEEITPHYAQLEQGFLTFFPQLIRHQMRHPIEH